MIYIRKDYLMSKNFSYYIKFVRDYIDGLLFRTNERLFPYDKQRVKSYFNGILPDTYSELHVASKDEPFYRPIFKSTYLEKRFNGSNLPRILDLGCGYGDTHRLLKQTYQCEYFGIDFAFESVKLAAHHKTDKTSHFLVGEITSLPLANNQFDIVLCINVIPYIDSVTEISDEIVRVTKSGALFGIILPISNPYWEINFDGISLCMHDPDIVKKTLAKQNFHLIEIDYIRFYPLPLLPIFTTYGMFMLFEKGN
jgi:ubiquinone/menaquinone biosynthesis C-methylase UbiE